MEQRWWERDLSASFYDYFSNSVRISALHRLFYPLSLLRLVRSGPSYASITVQSRYNSQWSYGLGKTAQALH